jgi:hypothetical protein
MCGGQACGCETPPCFMCGGQACGCETMPDQTHTSIACSTCAGQACGCETMPDQTYTSFACFTCGDTACECAYQQMQQHQQSDRACQQSDLCRCGKRSCPGWQSMLLKHNRKLLDLVRTTQIDFALLRGAHREVLKENESLLWTKEELRAELQKQTKWRMCAE